MNDASDEPGGAVEPGATILLVDDSALNLSLLSALLQPQYRVRTANSGASALPAG